MKEPVPPFRCAEPESRINRIPDNNVRVLTAPPAAAGAVSMEPKPGARV